MATSNIRRSALARYPHLSFPLLVLSGILITTNAQAFDPLQDARTIVGMLADFLNTTELVAIVNPDDPQASVTGIYRDYSALVTDTVPAVVPLPGALWLLGGAVSLLFGAHRRYRGSDAMTRGGPV